MKKLYSITLTITLMALLSACGGNSKSGVDSEHGLVNTPPAAESQSIMTGKNRQRSITLKATDANADKLSYRITTPPRHGTLSGAAPVLIYRPDQDYTGEDSFAFVVSDGVLDSDEVTVSITIGDGSSDSDDNVSTGSDDNTSDNMDNNSSSGLDDNASTGGNDNNGTGGGSDDDAGTGASDSNTTAGSDDNSSTGSDDNTTGGSDGNSSTGGSDSNTSDNTDNNSSSGSDNNSSTGGNDNNGTSGGSDDNSSTGGGAHTFTLKSLKLEIADTTLNKDHNTTLTLQAAYDDNTTNTPSNVEWLINPNDAVRIQGTTLTALKDTNVTMQAKVGNTLSNRVKLTIYWEVDGHRLPPEPDPKVNSATLLGVDVNKNGVRDDVERWIYDRYKDKHPIHIDIAMQAARGYKLVLEHPERAKEIREKVNGALICGWYYQHEAEEFGDNVLVHERIDSPVFGRYFNTKQRKDVYEQYDILLSGDSYDIPWADEMKAFCDFNTSEYDKE